MLYQEELRKLFYNVWYDEKYQYYFGSDYRWSFSTEDCNGENGHACHRFVSLNDEGSVLGYIGYSIDTDIRLATSFGAINFSPDIIVFGKDLRTAIDNIFCKFGIETLEFGVVCGNPIEESYDRIVEKIGGRILCVRHARAKDMAGQICDDKVYEITREQYFEFRKKG